ncbi:MAG TPA: hypothetical protein VK171_15060 [Fimbriimonas sp.]|nr:hypothetical protein [Fimbriimonas sp.]
MIVATLLLLTGGFQTGAVEGFESRKIGADLSGSAPDSGGGSWTIYNKTADTSYTIVDAPTKAGSRSLCVTAGLEDNSFAVLSSTHAAMTTTTPLVFSTWVYVGASSKGHNFGLIVQDTTAKIVGKISIVNEANTMFMTSTSSVVGPKLSYDTWHHLAISAVRRDNTVVATYLVNGKPVTGGGQPVNRNMVDVGAQLKLGLFSQKNPLNSTAGIAYFDGAQVKSGRSR